MKIWKRNAVVMTVVLFVCVALYLSWSYNREDPTDSLVNSLEDYANSGSPSDNLGDGPDDGTAAAAPDNPLQGYNVTMDGEDAGDTTVVGEDADVHPDTKGDYFNEMRLNRKRARDSAQELLKQAADREESDQSVRDQATAEIQNLAQAVMSEARIENLVMAKGFADCVAYLSGDSIDIVVAIPEGGLLASDVAKITDIVITETQLPASGIHIVEAGV